MNASLFPGGPRLIQGRNFASDTGLGRVAEARSRSVRVRNLPAGAQDGLLQQTLEKIALVKRVEVFVEQREAVVELENAAVRFTLSLFEINAGTLQRRKQANCCYEWSPLFSTAVSCN